MAQSSPTDPRNLKRTPLYSCHEVAGGRFVEFGGWEMPVQYAGVVVEHLNVRENAGLFDVSHMGEITVKGPNALKSLQYLTSNDLSKISPGKAQYSLLLNEQGGVVDDIIVYQLGVNDYFLCVNASNTDKDMAWITKNNIHGAEIENVSKTFAQVAVQGPNARQILAKLVGITSLEFSPENFPSFTLRGFEINLAGKLVPVIIATTGYTGEDGGEVFCPAESGADLWNQLMKIGEPFHLKPTGLGARDTLRLESSFPLHGHELRDDVSALESGFGWVIKLEKGDFIGREALLKEKQLGLKKKLVGLEVVDRGIIRDGNKLMDNSGKEIGWVSSGTKTPTLNIALGMGFVPVEFSKVGTELVADVRGKGLKVKVIPLPFYKR